jgi:hypothetical protein
MVRRKGVNRDEKEAYKAIMVNKTVVVCRVKRRRGYGLSTLGLVSRIYATAATNTDMHWTCSSLKILVETTLSSKFL